MALKIEMDEYGTGFDARYGAVVPHTTYFDKRFVDQYLALIDKYIEWEALAVQRGDVIDREIGVAKTWGVGGDIDLRFSLTSGNAANHFLLVESCAFGTCRDRALHFTKSNAIKLRALLEDFAAGNVTEPDLSVYR